MSRSAKAEGSRERRRKFCREMQELASDIEKDLRSREPENASQAAGLFMFVKGYKSFQASELLFASGFWQDAASIGRTLLELGFQARWLNLDPTGRGSLFVRHVYRDHKKLLRSLKDSGTDEIRPKAALLLEKMSSATDSEKSWRHWWAKESNIEKLAKALELSDLYDLLYKPLCWFVHSAPFSGRYYVWQDGGRLSFNCQPVEPASHDQTFAEKLLLSSLLGLFEVLAAVDTVYELKRQKQFDRVGRALKSYKEELQRTVRDRRTPTPHSPQRA